MIFQTAPHFPEPRRFPLDWEVGHSGSETAQPAEFHPAEVPGAVQRDFARAKSLPPLWIGENVRDYTWMEDCWWVYRARLQRPEISSGERLVLVCGGVDYSCVVRIDGRETARHEGMFSAFEIDLTDATEGALIEVVVLPAPKAPLPATLGGDILDHARKQARQSCKPAVSYGWDFHPRLVPLGIWEETFLEVRSHEAWLDRVEVRTEVAEDLSSAHLRLEVEGRTPTLHWSVLSPDGSQVINLRGQPEVMHARIDCPELWWPAGEGDAALYTSVVTVFDSDERATHTVRQRFGIRRIRLVMGPGQFNDTHGHPASQPPVPITFEVNGRTIFARGANWVCPDIFPGTLTSERYREQIDLVCRANLNFLRCWGGAIVNKDPFFDLCDERGILVWQEFPLACNDYEATPQYLRILDAESRAIIGRLRRRACLAVWCGGNELFNGWSGMTMQSHALRLLDRNCFDLDPDRPFLPTSPLIGIRHGDYRFLIADHETDPATAFQIYHDSRARAFLEFGVPGPASAQRLREIIPEDQIWPVRPDAPAWRTHHGFGAWSSSQPGSWLYPEAAARFFGSASTLDELVAQLQFLQAAGYKAIYEEARRQKPYCSAAACWVFNEPWPAAANNSLIAWPNTPKPAFEAVAEANRPVMLSARIARIDWAPGAFTAELYLLNDSPREVPNLKVAVALQSESGEQSERTFWNCPGTPAGTHLAGPLIQPELPAWSGRTFTLLVEAEDERSLSSRYQLLFKHSKPAA